MLGKLTQDEGPIAHVCGFFLHPVELFYVGVFRKGLTDLLFGEGVQLFYAEDSGIVFLVFAAGLEEVVEDFTRA
jgi:hypothetical protein